MLEANAHKPLKVGPFVKPMQAKALTADGFVAWKRFPLWDAGFAAVVALSAVPLWLVRYPPIQDLPQHLAAIRVLHSYADPSFGFSDLFALELGRTQYLTYYVAADLLSYLVELTLANKLLLTACLWAGPWGLWHLLQSLGRDPRAALFMLPLAYNAHLILGFFNFLAAIPMMFFGLALAVRQRLAPTRVRAIGLSVLALVTFYTHVVPFGLLALGTALVSLSASFRGMLARLLPLLPALIGAALWSVSPAGRSTLGVAVHGDGGPAPKYRPWSQALSETGAWLTDIFKQQADDRLLVCWGLALLVAWVVGRGPTAEPGPTPQQSLCHMLCARLGLLAPLCALAYFLLPASYAWIWPIAPRFPLLAALFMVVALPHLPRWAGRLVFAGALVLGLLHSAQAARAFKGFEREVGALDAALAQIPARQRVAGLIWDRGSGHVKFAPFIHSVAYYQVRKGGAVMFTFADFPQSPFRFRDEDRPPPVPPRWEWTPERVEPARDLAWYDYVLVRGGPGAIAHQRQHYEPVYRGPRWSVWKRLRSPPIQAGR